jgi:hypothetical protein
VIKCGLCNRGIDDSTGVFSCDDCNYHIHTECPATKEQIEEEKKKKEEEKKDKM